MKILVTGAKGQLGSEIKKISSKNNNFQWVFTDRKSFDISILENIKVFCDECMPNIIINCAAYTSVDNAENDYETVNIVNNKAIGLIANWCKDNNSKLIHISTDYVYDGSSLIPIKEDAEANPINNYGKTKLFGDQACMKNNHNSIIFRTSWLYSSFGNNFLKKMFVLMQNCDEIEVVNDQISSPTYAGDLASVILHLIKNKKWHSGIYNYSNAGKASWYDFANEIKSICKFNTKIKPISSKYFFQKAMRPKYSLLDNSKIINTFKIRRLNYIESLRKCIKILQDES